MSALTGGITVGQLSCFLSYANQYTKPFNEISGVITELQNALACAARIFELIEEKKEIPDASDAVTLDEADGRVDIEDVYFSYVPDKKAYRGFQSPCKAWTARGYRRSDRLWKDDYYQSAYEIL